MTCTGDRNFSRCRECGALFENHNETLTVCPKHMDPYLPARIAGIELDIATLKATNRKDHKGRGRNDKEIAALTAALNRYKEQAWAQSSGGSATSS